MNEKPQYEWNEINIPLEPKEWKKFSFSIFCFHQA